MNEHHGAHKAKQLKVLLLPNLKNVRIITNSRILGQQQATFSTSAAIA